ncbi:hypothetical protein [Lewinella cohaerens]|uniref:hypothetical protein n=1 Tax=Lewinella cohaerens TaxID=70995 RepID=UPI0003A882C8|nr:hypothetical protein [Lewinella cohaerens]
MNQSTLRSALPFSAKGNACSSADGGAGQGMGRSASDRQPGAAAVFAQQRHCRYGP